MIGVCPLRGLLKNGWKVLKEDYGMRISKNKMSRITVIITGVMLLGLSFVVQAADWNMWGKDAGHTSFTADSVEPPLKVSWVFDLGFRSPGFEPIGPVISNNTVYAGGITVDNQNVQHWLFAVNARSGELIWKYKTDWDIRGIAASDALIVVNDRMNIYAFSNGVEKWRHEIGSGNLPEVGSDSLPLIIYKNLVLSGQVFALSVENGSLIWKYEPELPKEDETHLVSNTALPLAAGEDKVILAVQSIETYYTGPRVPTVTEPPKPGDPIPPEPPRNISTIVIALNAETGKEEWVKRIPFLIESTPVISKGKLFIGSKGSVQAYLLKDGSDIWRAFLPAFRKVEAAKDDLLFVNEGLDGKNVAALSMNDGRMIRTYPSALDFSSLSVSGDILYIGGSSNSAILEALNTTTGEPIWRGIKVQGYNSASKPAISGDKLFLIVQDGKLYALSHGTKGAPSLGAVLSMLVMIVGFMVYRRNKSFRYRRNYRYGKFPNDSEARE